MNVSTWLNNAVTALKLSGIATARLDALVLLEDATNKDRAWLLAHPEFILDEVLLHKLNSNLQRRTLHEPLAYIRGKSEFYGREFIVTADTLQPRPETETMITSLKRLKLPPEPNIIDVGTGSGCIAITAALEIPGSHIFATEINDKAYKIALANSRQLEADVEFSIGSLLGPFTNEKLDVVLANLPYVPDSFTINKAAMQEPKIAIFGGPDGLDLYRDMFVQISKLPNKPSFVLTESLPAQHENLDAMAKQYGYKLSESEDFIQVFTQ